MAFDTSSYLPSLSYRPYVYSISKGSYFDFSEVGSGLSFIAPILCGIQISRFGIIQQPELHLHPKAQCEMGDVFISGINQFDIQKKRCSYLIETHSENLLLRLSRRIRECTYNKTLDKNLKISPDDVAIYYFEPQKSGKDKGFTKVHHIRFDQDGEFLDRWPDGFFAERQDEYPDEWWDEKPTKK